MRVDKAGHYDAPSGVDDLAGIANQTLNLSTPADSFDLLAAQQDRAVFNDGKLTEISADARPFCPRQGHDL